LIFSIKVKSNIYNIFKTADYRLGSEVSFETRAKLSEAHKGRTPPNKDKPTSTKVKIKLSKVLSGENHYNYGKSLFIKTRILIN
jgi:hypothetical protein